MKGLKMMIIALVATMAFASCKTNQGCGCLHTDASPAVETVQDANS